MVAQERSWVLLSYRIPREPSTPRIAVWRRLKKLGVAQVGDGLVALPANAVTQEQLEWVAVSIHEADGEAIVWLADTGMRAAGEHLAAQLNAARAEEYEALRADVVATPTTDRRTITRWRRALREISARDHLGAPGRDAARLAILDRARDEDGGSDRSAAGASDRESRR